MIGKLEDLVKIVGNEKKAKEVQEKYLLIERDALPEVDEKHHNAPDYIYIDGSTTYTYPGVESDLLEDMDKQLAHLSWAERKSVDAGPVVESVEPGVLRVAQKLAEKSDKARGKDWESLTVSQQAHFISEAKDLVREFDQVLGE